jgi:hypothetical protein
VSGAAWSAVETRREDVRSEQRRESCMVRQTGRRGGNAAEIEISRSIRFARLTTLSRCRSNKPEPPPWARATWHQLLTLLSCEYIYHFLYNGIPPWAAVSPPFPEICTLQLVQLAVLVLVTEGYQFDGTRNNLVFVLPYILVGIWNPYLSLRNSETLQWPRSSPPSSPTAPNVQH